MGQSSRRGRTRSRSNSDAVEYSSDSSIEWGLSSFGNGGFSVGDGEATYDYGVDAHGTDYSDPSAVTEDTISYDTSSYSSWSSSDSADGVTIDSNGFWEYDPFSVTTGSEGFYTDLDHGTSTMQLMVIMIIRTS